MPLSTGLRLGPYEILAPIGRGGMGEVYRARDLKLERDVAVKVLPESVANDPEALARFAREAKAVAALSHPNILAIHDFGNEGGIAFAVMELLEGETLRARLDSGPLSTRRAVEYAVQVAKGLSAAHERGVVHRDLKPENLFVSRDGHLKILDFGLAKRDERVAPGAETSAPTVSGQTQPGVVMGTMGYMSPEQVRGLPVDPRSDLFSFGAILYEMISGARAFSRSTANDTMAAILRDEPPELDGPGRGVSPALAQVVRHCLEKDREDRFQSAKDVAFALSQAADSGSALVPREARGGGRRRSLLAAGLVVVLAAVGVFLLRRAHGVAAPRRVARVAVLPFENLGSPEDDYFADGIADEVRGKLTTLPGIEVIARGSSTPYRKTTKTPQQVARELDVGYLLTATVRWQKGPTGSRVHVSPELVEVKAAGAPASKWQQPFDAALTDVFQVQSDIATRVAQALGVELGSGQEKQLSERPTQDLAAYDAFLKGQDIWKGLAVGDPPGVRKALGFYDQAVALDPGFAQAWARIAWGNASLYINSVPTQELADRSRDAAERAIALAPDRPEGHHALGNYRRMVMRDLNGALEQYAHGLRLAPANADLLTATALAEESLGRWKPAVEHLRQAARLDPRSIPTRLRLGEALLWLRRHSEAREVFDQGLAIAPRNPTLLVQKAMTFLAQGDLPGARAVLRSAPKAIEPAAFVAYVASTYDLAWVLDEEQRDLLLRLTTSAFDDDRAAWAFSLLEASEMKGDAANVRIYAEEARKALEEQARPQPVDFQRRVYLGLALAYLGRKDEAVMEGVRGAGFASWDAVRGASARHGLVLIYTKLGETTRALDELEALLKVPYYLSPGWLRVDPNFEPLRENPRFQRLIAAN